MQAIHFAIELTLYLRDTPALAVYFLYKSFNEGALLEVWGTRTACLTHIEGWVSGLYLEEPQKSLQQGCGRNAQ